MTNGKEFEITRVLNAPVATVWKAITDSSEMKQWYFDLPGFRPEVGYRFEFTAGPPEKQYLHLCEVTHVIAGKKISYTWKYDGYPGKSEVSFELTPEGSQTILRLTHKGLDTFPLDNPDFAAKNFAEGWTQIVGSSLPAYLESMLPDSPNKTETTEKGLVFTRPLNAPRETVWKVWTDPKHLAEWWGPKGFTNPVCKLDLSTGGFIYIEMKGPDGVSYPMDGEIHEIVSPERLVFTTAALDKNGARLFEVFNDLTLHEEGGKTKLILRTEVSKLRPEGEQHIAGMSEGWNQSLDRLNNYASTL